MLFVYLYSDILPFFHRDIYVINTFVCTYRLKSTRHCRVDMQFELLFSIYFYKWHICITCCVMGRIWIMRQICVILGLSWIWACLGRRSVVMTVLRYFRWKQVIILGFIKGIEYISPPNSFSLILFYCKWNSNEIGQKVITTYGLFFL